MSAVAHYIAGVLGHESMAQIVDELCEAADWKAGDRVKTLRGSMSGSIRRVVEDGRVVWQTDSGSELTTLPESPIREGKP
jgi:threonine dehydrogenase-like Zn-dependent dehydrogenase